LISQTINVLGNAVAPAFNRPWGACLCPWAIIFDWLEENCHPEGRLSLAEQVEHQASASAQDAARLIQKYQGVDVGSSVPRLALV
jgi:hypothetical protein